MIMLYLQMMLAEAVVSHGTQGEVSTITTSAISAIVGAIVTGLALYFKSRSKVTVDGEVNVREEGRQRRQEVSWTEVRDLKDRMSQVERRIDEIKSAQGKNFVMIMENQHASELRVLEKIENCVKPVHTRLDNVMQMLADKPNKE